ncbi:SRPBCC domain-containing protein [Streptomyces sp. UNOB3_S3]|uniref:SRPBCC domain-containing protein n=1 Tax=Streptomyces sp. UNOB3_S3 TaxID=2871682 RepID=UPI001E5F06BE|nr:SRPBCC domain-containing protein [Streptomyces sp. UNOB3_S3]MCC3774214.1 SRPBCC domain-containing protein [Streptomyces sp. UNOB3_S3]
MRSIETFVNIDAPLETVWDVIVDFDRYGEWNPFILEARGKAEAGRKLWLRMQRPAKPREEVHTPTVTVVEKNRHLQWSGVIRHATVFRARHEFLLEETASGVRLRQREDFGGLTMPLAGGMVWRIEEGFLLMNAALKVRAEALR